MIQIKDFIEKIFYFENQIQLKHWQEERGWHHEYLGTFYEKLTLQFDELVECYIAHYKTITVKEVSYALTNNIDTVDTYIIELNKFIDVCSEELAENSELVGILDDTRKIISRYTYLLSKK